MPEIVVIDVAADADLQDFSRYLWSQGISHRIVEQQQRKLLLVGDPAIAVQVRDAYESRPSDPDSDWQPPNIQQPQRSSASNNWLKLCYRLPATLTLIFLSIVGCAIVYVDSSDLNIVRYLTFYDFEVRQSSIIFSIAEGQYWRLITPIFLHFGLLHLAFNMTLLWFVGQRIELLQSRTRMLAICLLVGLGSNIAQAIYSEIAIFGGMSGVVYGLLGYSWVWSRLCPDQDLHVPNALVYFSVVMLVLGFVGFTAILGPGKVANLAHFGGLVMGAVLGAGMALIHRSGNQPDKG